MKSRKVKAAAKTKSFLSKKKLRGNIPVDVRSDSEADSGSDIYNDEIDEFHQREDEKLSTDDELIDHDEDSSEEEEVLPITDDEKDNEWDNYDEDEDEKNDSDQKEDEDLPNSEAWGRKKSVYFNADFVDEDRGRTYREEDAEAAKAEAEEALAIQKSVLSSITTNNLGGNLQFGDLSEEEEEETEEVVNWQFVTKQEKMKFLKKTCPEFLTFIKEFKEKLTEVKDKLIPFMHLVEDKKILSQDLAMYIKVKYHLLLHICMNISAYMMMRSKDSVVSSHPVLQRIAAYKKLLDELENVNETIPSELDVILEKLKQNEKISFEDDVQKQTILPSKKATTNIIKSVPEKQEKRKIKQFETEAEKEIFSLYMDMKEQQKKENTEKEKCLDEICEEPMDMEEDASGEKRTITYQIAKNKGLVPHRKKEYRNPRVRHRMKYRKAKIRRKGQVREVVKELKRYEGEPTGISAHVVRSIKLK